MTIEDKIINLIRYYTAGSRGYYGLKYQGKFYSDADTGDLVQKVLKDIGKEDN